MGQPQCAIQHELFFFFFWEKKTWQSQDHDSQLFLRVEKS